MCCLVIKRTHMKFKRENKDYSPHNVLGHDLLSGVLAADAFSKLIKPEKADELSCRPLNVTFIYVFHTPREAFFLLQMTSLPIL